MINYFTVPVIVTAIFIVLPSLAGDPTRPPQFLTPLKTTTNQKTENKSPVLQQIRMSSSSSSAVINGKLMYVGDQVNGIKVLNITPNNVVVKFRGNRRTLSLIETTKYADK